MELQRVAIVGVGLLGGSIGLALKSRGLGAAVMGFGHRPSTLQRALEMGAIDQACQSLPQAVADADLVILCTPVGLFESLLGQMASDLKPGAVVTDVGSTKRSVVRQAHKQLPRGVHFVGSHPMAGSEKRGIDYARADLFAGATCLLTPVAKTHAPSLAAVERFWTALGMRTCRLSPAEHDRKLAAISHLPHAVAAALVHLQQDAALELAGKGFLDSTRIAGGDAGLWRDIFLDNRDQLGAAVARMRAQLAALARLLRTQDAAALTQWLEKAAQRREALMQKKLRDMSVE